MFTKYNNNSFFDFLHNNHPYKVSILKITFCVCVFFFVEQETTFPLLSKPQNVDDYGYYILCAYWYQMFYYLCSECFYNFRFLELLLWQSMASLLSYAQSCGCRFVSGRRWANSFCN